MVGEDGGGDETLEDTEWPKSESGTQDGEEAIEEGDWPANFGHDESDDLEDDEETVHDSPEDSSGLVGNCAIPGKGKRVNENTNEKIDR